MNDMKEKAMGAVKVFLEHATHAAQGTPQGRALRV